jgi:hypothetical protein
LALHGLAAAHEADFLVEVHGQAMARRSATLSGV